MEENKILESEALLRKIIDQRCQINDGRLNYQLSPQLESFDCKQKTAVISFATKEWQLNPYGDVHGGIISTMLDTAMGITAHWLSDGKRCTTMDLNINYLAPVPNNDRFEVHVKVQKVGRTLLRLISEGVVSSDGTLAAAGMGNFMILDKK